VRCRGCSKLTNYRDDLTVEVIFFGNSPSTGNVTLNKAASAPEPDVKAKL
jgi:pyruvate dehydrogenase phosphatase